MTEYNTTIMVESSEHVQTSLVRLLSKLKNYLLFYKTGYPNEEVDHTEPFPSVSVP
jgi:hypothetical protein